MLKCSKSGTEQVEGGAPEFNSSSPTLRHFFFRFHALKLKGLARALD